MSVKQGRMSDRIQQILSQILLREIADPRLRGLTVTEVQLDPELMVAKIFVSAMGDDDRHDEVMTGLRRAQGYLRRELGKRIRLRATPELHFYWDHSLAHAERIHQLIDKLVIPPEAESDEQDES